MAGVEASSSSSSSSSSSVTRAPTMVGKADMIRIDSISSTNSGGGAAAAAGNPNSNNVLRNLAQEVTSFYIDRRHPYVTHSNNIQEHLRYPMIALTTRILLQQQLQKVEREKTTTTTTTTPTPQAYPPHGSSSKDLSATTTTTVTAVSTAGTTDSEKVTVESWRESLLQSFNGDNKSSFSLHDFFSTLNTSSMETMYNETMDVRMKARLDAFLDGIRLAIISDENLQLSKKQTTGDTSQQQRQGSVDSTDLSLIEGLVGFRSLGIGSNKNSNTTTMKVVSIPKPKKSQPIPCPQINEMELVTRIELYLRSISRVVTYHNDCVIEYEPQKALKARTKFVVMAFINTVGTVRHVNPVLTRLLITLTKELLAVPVLSENILRIIRNIVSNYVHATSFASLAFLSSPEISADQQLTPAILKYLHYLQNNWYNVERECDIELMLSTIIDPQLRQLYKTAEFQSIGHLLEVYQSHRYMLQNIIIPPRVVKERDSEEVRIQQAIKDISREVIAVNGSVLPRITNKLDLIQLLTSALNIRPLYIEGDHNINTNSTTRRNNRRGYNKKKKNHGNKKASRLADGGTDTLSAAALSGNEADTDSNYVLSDSSMYDTDGGLTDDTGGGSMTTNTNTTITSTIARRKFATTSIVDLLTKRLLLAASRTGTMGDAYFVVCDLFGGEDVEVVPSSQHLPSGLMMHSNAPIIHPTTIDLYVRLSSITIKSHASFDVYPKSMVGDCEPLIQIHATTTETIALQEVRNTSSNDITTSGGQQNEAGGDNNQPSNEQQQQPKSDRVLLERVTEMTGYRFLSIRPALYEKVSTWQTTPS